MADAANLSTPLDESHEAAEQIAFADIVLLNKIELVDAATLTAVETRLRAMKSTAKIIRTARCNVDLDRMLGLKAFELKRVLEIEPDFLTEDHAHEHDDAVTSISLHSDVPIDPHAFQIWFSRLLCEKGQDLLRSKGIIDMKGEDQRYILPGVHVPMDGNLLGPWPTDKPRKTKLLFIGRNLDSMGLREGFESCKTA